MISRKLFIFTSILVAALFSLLLLLIYWGNKSIMLREELFVDRVSKATEEMISEMEDEYYCFDLTAEMSLPKLDSFFLSPPPGYERTEKDHLELTHTSSNGEKMEFQSMPLMGPAHMQMLLRFEFDDIPDFREDSTLTDFEKYVRDSYRHSIFNEDGIRLIDTVDFPQKLMERLSELYPEIHFLYEIKYAEHGELVHSNAVKRTSLLKSDFDLPMFKGDARIPELLMSLKVTNKETIFSVQRWLIYGSAALLSLISVSVLFLLVRMYLQQKRLLKAQRDFVHGMTHEFNTPLSNIKLVSQKLLKANDPFSRKSASILEQEAAKLQTGMNLILTTALIEKNELLLARESLNVKSLLQSSVDRNRENLQESGIEVNLNLDEDDLQILGDSFHLENVFQNLINNARKHSDGNRVFIDGKRVNGHIEIRFADNGKGIDEKIKERLFEKFESRNGNGSPNGYGLGLYYSRMILEMHGGKINLLEENPGSAFIIELPYEKV